MAEVPVDAAVPAVGGSADEWSCEASVLADRVPNGHDAPMMGRTVRCALGLVAAAICSVACRPAEPSSADTPGGSVSPTFSPPLGTLEPQPAPVGDRLIDYSLGFGGIRSPLVTGEVVVFGGGVMASVGPAVTLDEAEVIGLVGDLHSFRILVAPIEEAEPTVPAVQVYRPSLDRWFRPVEDYVIGAAGKAGDRVELVVVATTGSGSSRFEAVRLRYSTEFGQRSQVVNFGGAVCEKPVETDPCTFADLG